MSTAVHPLSDEEKDAKNRRYRKALHRMSAIALQLGLTDSEAAILGAQFAGMAMARMPLACHDAYLEICGKAMDEARKHFMARRMV